MHVSHQPGILPTGLQLRPGEEEAVCVGSQEDGLTSAGALDSAVSLH